MRGKAAALHDSCNIVLMAKGCTPPSHGDLSVVNKDAWTRYLVAVYFSLVTMVRRLLQVTTRIFVSMRDAAASTWLVGYAGNHGLW